jgi:ATP-dependent RNA helicase DDX1
MLYEPPELRRHMLCRRALYPALCLKNAEIALNFGATPFAYGPPSGYVGVAAAPPTSIVTGTAVA